MSLHTRPKLKPTSTHRRGGDNGTLVAADLSAELAIIVPRTSREWAACQRRRDRYRLAIGIWAIERARADKWFCARHEWVAMIRQCGLTRADDADLHRRYLIRSAAVTKERRAGNRRAMTYRDRQGG